MKIITIEGTDASGKATQSKLLKENLEKAGFVAKVISFPNYDSPSSDKIKQYLAGEKFQNVTPYDIGKLFADDRYYTFKKLLDTTGVDFLIIDRYVSSNFIHQCSKIEDRMDKIDFINHFLVYEYDILKMPKPDLELFLDMPRDFADILMDNRGRSDIHENDKPYLNKCYDNAKWVSELLGWFEISCVDENMIMPVDIISDEILDIVEEVFHI